MWPYLPSPRQTGIITNIEEPNMDQIKKHGSSTFYKLLEGMSDLHDRKSHDYASQSNPMGNYHFAGKLSQLFKNSNDAGFIGRLGEKLFRLANLENSGKEAKNESVEDTELDICVITTLWMADRRDRRFNKRELELNKILNEKPLSSTEQARATAEYATGRLLELEAYVARLTEANRKLTERVNDYESRATEREENRSHSRIKRNRRKLRSK